MKRPIIAIQKYDDSVLSDRANDTYEGSLPKCEEMLSAHSNETIKQVMTYIGYYVATLLYNGILFAFYIVQVFSYHHPCVTRMGVNVTGRFQFMFISGLCLLAADMVNTNLINIYYRFKVQAEEREFGMVTEKTRKMHLASLFSEWGFRGGTILITLAQLIVRTSRKGRYCTHKEGLLQSESQWLDALIYMQIFKVVFFSIWQARIAEQRQISAYDQMDKEKKLANAISFGQNSRSQSNSMTCTFTTPELRSPAMIQKNILKVMKYDSYGHEFKSSQPKKRRPPSRKVKPPVNILPIDKTLSTLEEGQCEIDTSNGTADKQFGLSINKTTRDNYPIGATPSKTSTIKKLKTPSFKKNVSISVRQKLYGFQQSGSPELTEGSNPKSQTKVPPAPTVSQRNSLKQLTINSREFSLSPVVKARHNYLQLTDSEAEARGQFLMSGVASMFTPSEMMDTHPSPSAKSEQTLPIREDRSSHGQPVVQQYYSNGSKDDKNPQYDKKPQKLLPLDVINQQTFSKTGVRQQMMKYRSPQKQDVGEFMLSNSKRQEQNNYGPYQQFQHNETKYEDKNDNKKIMQKAYKNIFRQKSQQES